MAAGSWRDSAGIMTWEGFEVADGGLYLFTAEAPPGEYELVLSVRDEVAGKTIENRQAFSLLAPAALTAA